MREQIEIARNDMGITHSDFQRIFPRLIEDCKNFIVGTETTVNWSSGQKLTVYVSKEKIRNIAVLRIPYVDLRFVFVGFLLHDVERFMVRFDLAFHKGGG